MDQQDIVDRDWYLHTNADVRAAGMDASYHFNLYGQYEGRHPRLLRSALIEQALWAGFSNIAIEELEQICETEEPHVDCLYARWALALWYGTSELWECCYANLLYLKNAPEFIMYQPAFTLLNIEANLKLGNIQEALSQLSDGAKRSGYNNNLVLMRANILRAADKSDNAVLSSLNQIFCTAGLSKIKKIDAGLPACFRNIRGTVKQKESDNLSEVCVSVLMPVYNAAETVEFALCSILNQTWRNLEVIVIDDCSTDDTLARVHKIANRDRRVQIVHHEANLGAYAARNSGLGYATGNLITNHDSDDWAHPERIAKCVKALEANTDLVAVFTNWVRVDRQLYFKIWNYRSGLIEPTVSSLMFRKEAIAIIGGWDQVRVAADSELLERITQIWGRHAVIEVYPGTPLVLALHWIGSLTTAPDTHAKTSFSGVRRDYRVLYQGWHKIAVHPHGLHLSPALTSRRFPAPARIDLSENKRETIYDFVIYCDFSVAAEKELLISDLLTKLIHLDYKIGIFNWPLYKETDYNNSSAFILDRLIEGQISLISDYEIIETEKLYIIPSQLLKNAPDNIPSVFFDVCQPIEWSDLPSLTSMHTGVISSPGICPSVVETFRGSRYFDSHWYREAYPDVKAANVDPAWHYLTYGWKEGREPSRDFDSHWYRRTYPGSIVNYLPPAWHFLSIGSRLGYLPSNPHYSGQQSYKEGYLTIAVCGHASSSVLFGAERSLIDTIRALSELSVNVIVALPSSENPKYISLIRSLASNVYILPSHIQIKDPSNRAKEIKDFKSIFLKHDVHAVYVNTIVHQSPVIAANELGIYCGIHVHESLDNDADLCDQIGLTPYEIRAAAEYRASIIIPNSKFTASFFSKDKLGSVVPNVPEPLLFNCQNQIDTSSIKIALISSNTPKKGLADFCELGKRLAEVKNASLLIIGPNNAYTDSLKIYIADTLINNITFIDYCDDSTTAISNANIVVNLSHCLETFGRTILEAMAAGRTVVAYDRGALPELIEDGVTGLIVPYLDINELANKITELCINPSSILVFGDAARDATRAGYSNKILQSQLSKNYPYLNLLPLNPHIS